MWRTEVWGGGSEDVVLACECFCWQVAGMQHRPDFWRALMPLCWLAVRKRTSGGLARMEVGCMGQGDLGQG